MKIELPAVRPDAEKERDDGEALPPANVAYLNYRVLEKRGWSLDDDLFEKTAAADLSELDYGTFAADRTESVLRSAEENGLEWPFQCRSSTGMTCAGVVTETEMDTNLVLKDEARNFAQLASCSGIYLLEVFETTNVLWVRSESRWSEGPTERDGSATPTTTGGMCGPSSP